MSEETFNVEATARTEQGRGAMRRLRREGAIPAIIYGGKSEPQNVSLRVNEMRKHLEHEAFYSHILTINVDGKPEQAILKDLQRHPYRQDVLHVDFQRVVAGEKLTVNVPLHFINETSCKGVKEGGVVQHVITDLEVRCLPRDLPEYIEVDMADIELGGNVHLHDIKAPAGVEILALAHGEDLTVAAVNTPRVAVEADDEEEATDAGEVPAAKQSKDED